MSAERPRLDSVMAEFQNYHDTLRKHTQVQFKRALLDYQQNRQASQNEEYNKVAKRKYDKAKSMEKELMMYFAHTPGFLYLADNTGDAGIAQHASEHTKLEPGGEWPLQSDIVSGLMLVRHPDDLDDPEQDWILNSELSDTLDWAGVLREKDMSELPRWDVNLRGVILNQRWIRRTRRERGLSE